MAGKHIYDKRANVSFKKALQLNFIFGNAKSGKRYNDLKLNPKISTSASMWKNFKMEVGKALDYYNK
jgi:hypothetical protein